MFLDLFYGLRDAGVPVAIQEWQAFLGKALPLLVNMQSVVLVPTPVSPMK